MTSDLGGTLIYHFWPDLKIFADDRNPYYGEDFYIDEFFEILLMGDRWQEVLDKYEVTAAVIGRSDASLGTLFKASPKWELVLEDDLNTIFVRRSSVDP